MEVGQRVGKEQDGVCLEHIGIIHETPSGWKTEVNVVSWFGKEGKIDIRNWSTDYSKSSPHSLFSDEEMEILIGLMSDRLRV